MPNGTILGSTSAPLSRCLVIHRVNCDGQNGHDHHMRVAHYRDIPRMYTGDSKASALRGREPIENVDSFLEDTGINIIVFNNYSCTSYQEAVDGQFEQLQLPSDPEIPPTILPYFFRLRGDCEIAESQFTELELASTDFKDTITRASGISQEHLSDLRDPRTLSLVRQRLYHLRRSLHYLDAKSLDTYREDIECLFGLLSNTLSHDFEEADALFSCGRVTKPHLGKLFCMNDLVVTFNDGHPNAYILEEFVEPSQSPIVLKCWSWDFDGSFFQKKTAISLTWPSSALEVQVSDLNIYPLRFGTSDLEMRLRTRGTKFWAYRNKEFVSYPSFDDNSDSAPVMGYSRYMLDLGVYQKMYPASSSRRHGSETSPVAQMPVLSTLQEPKDDRFYLLLPAVIVGFGFHDKRWRSLSVEHITAVEWNKKAFDRVAMPQTKKEILSALVLSHASSNKLSVVNDQGEGLTILLYGGPGTGKTLTAESLSELARAPLYRVTIGDIGTNPEEIEKYLETVLFLGRTWGCFILLDEASIFVESGDATDLRRNAAVSVFLRVIEYYHGVIFITCNAISTFDVAFKSRIRFTLHFPALEPGDRVRIWGVFIEDLREKGRKIEYEELKDGITILSTHSLNGREIRGTINTALSLASWKREPLRLQHLLQVIDITNEFEAHSMESYGHSL